MKKLLIIDDEQSITWGLTQVANEMGLQAQAASSAEGGLELAAGFRPDAIVLDVRLPGMSGLEAMQRLRDLTDNAPIIITTAYGDLETAVAAVRNGAFEYVVKPFDTAQIQQAIQRALSAGEAPQAAPRSPAVAGFIGDSPAMQRVYNRIALAASGDVPVLLQGESGVGKELAARAIHRFSPRSAGPLVVVNLAALNPSLAESELFGHVRGAFTGADQARTGLLAAAEGGTLFLDEVAEIPLPTQVKLLRVLEQGELAPVGSDVTRRINFRLVCATHRDLPGMVRRGEFRHDLFFRVTAFQIDIPPLRERPEDVEALAAHFVAEFGGERRPSLSRAALAHLKTLPWAGNVRELRNAMEHACLLARSGEIQPAHLPVPSLELAASDRQTSATTSLASSTPGSSSAAPLEQELAEAVARWAESHLQAHPEAQTMYDRLLTVVEPAVLEVLLRRRQGRVAAVARALGIHRTTVRRKIDQYGLDSQAD